mmetsp:Transcript_6961/g.8381  ORF Transcript_6961/g.8381 Transcript_6961/m.8381 type:complete len:83 (+) Transcript_6961:965-1213(+)
MQTPMISAFSCSFYGRLITVEYKLVACVKHNAWNSWGDGETIDLPVMIMQAPLQIAAPQPMQAPANWKPTVYEQVVINQPIP